MSSPAKAPRQLVGVFAPEWVRPMAEVLGRLGSERAWVVHGSGLDELTTAGVTTVAALEGGKVETFEILAKDVGLPPARIEDLRGGEPQHNARLMQDLLAGVGGPLRDVVLLNSGAALLIAGRADSLEAGIELAARSLDFRRGSAGAARADRPHQRGDRGRGDCPVKNVLAEICAEKRAHVARAKTALSENALLAELAQAPPPRPFAAALDRRLAEGRFGLIAEIKKASPSAGLIREDFDASCLARAYAAGGASCLSVLTDAPYFQGSDEDLRAARRQVALPVLRKDFILDPYQILESRHIGADCILLIMAALSDCDSVRAGGCGGRARSRCAGRGARRGRTRPSSAARRRG